MNTQPKFYLCKHCGNVIQKICDSGVKVHCCGDEMTELVAGTTDAAVEKHVPFVQVEGNKVTAQIGEVIHPMTDEHHIAFIYLQTDKGGMRVDLPHDGEPKAEFVLADGEKAIAVYEYCNLHGLWKKDLA